MRLLPLILLYVLSLPMASAQSRWYVSPKGADTAIGDEKHPIRSLPLAFRKVREWRRLNPSAGDTARILLMDGTHTLSEPLTILPDDAGTATSPTLVAAAPKARAVVSGGVEIGNWQPVTPPYFLNDIALGSTILVADISDLPLSLFSIRQLWVNGQKGTRAQDAKGQAMARIYSWNKKEMTVKIPAGLLKKVKDFRGMEMFIHQWWAIANLRIRDVHFSGDTATLWFHAPEDRIQSEHPWPAPWMSAATGNSAFKLVNALEFLDEPGEWYHDIRAQKLYYMPRKYETPSSIRAVAPVLETLVQIKGAVNQPVSNIHFRGITFSHSTYQAPSYRGHVPHQIGMHMLNAYRLNPTGTSYKAGLDNVAWIDRPTAAISIEYSEKIRFDRCVIAHVGSTGIDFHRGVHQSVFYAGLLKDVGGNGILSGIFSDSNQEIHKPYQPKDLRDVNTHIRIENNLISDVTNEDWSCAGIALGFQQHARVIHNEIEEVSYSGISMGWGWNPQPNPNRDNRIESNYIHHFGKRNYDCAGIYNLGRQTGGVIAYNRVENIYKAPYAHLPTHWFYLYADEGSSELLVKQNWTPTTKYLQNANGPDNQWTGNGPSVSDSIKQAAGLLPKQPFLYAKNYQPVSRFSINEEREELIELFFPDDSKTNLDSVKRFLKRYGLDTAVLYQWKSHVVIYSKVVDIAVLEGRITNNFPKVRIKVFHDLFYQYDRRDCKEAYRPETPMQHYVLTANMRKDPIKQQQYLDYHLNQRAEWPEVAQGFCHAGFERLQLFRNGRQLMLVISIPKGKNLDGLNPKTIENNPRMVEWNKRMANFQEGIEDAPKGETWVFFNQQ